MASNNSFQMMNEHGWRAGFSNLLYKENRDWWGTRRWLVQAIIWAAILNGVLAMALFTSAKSGGAGATEAKDMLGLTIFFALAGIALGMLLVLSLVAVASIFFGGL